MYNLDQARKRYFDGLVQDYSIFIAKALEILQSCIKPLICIPIIFHGLSLPQLQL